MDYIIHLPEFRIVICKTCWYAILPSEIDAHFRIEQPHGFTKEARGVIVQRVGRIEGLIQDQRELKECKFPFPPDTSGPIVALGTPNANGVRCVFDIEGGQCPFVGKNVKRI